MPNFFKKHYINDILFYEPKIFNEKVALSCRLFPFTRQKLQLLAVMDIIVGEEEIKKRLKNMPLLFPEQKEQGRTLRY